MSDGLKVRVFSASLMMACLLLSSGAFAAPLAPGNFWGSIPEAPKRLENFRLLDHEGFSRELYHQGDAKALVIITHFVGCPAFKEQSAALKQLTDDFVSQGVQFWLINPKESDSPEAIAEEMKALGLDIPVMRDEAQAITRSLGFKSTCEAMVCLPNEDWKVAWRGGMGGVQNALQSVLKQEVPAQAETTAAVGCPIPYAEVGELSYTKDIAPILTEKCLSCHTKGGIGPFPMSSYEKVQGWAEMMRETLRTQLMPPWQADPHYGAFKNDRGIAPKDKRALLAWLDAGAPWDGKGTDPLKEAYEAAVADEWKLGDPDLVLQLPFGQEIKARGIEDYRYLTVQTNLTEDKWVQAIEVKPTNNKVVHHVLIFVMYPPQYAKIQPKSDSGLGGFYAAYLPGSIIKPFPEGYAQFLPSGSSFVFQMHYNTTGKEEMDQTKMALYFADAAPKMAVQTRAASETDFSIPPNDPDSMTQSDFRFRKDAVLLGMAPHMHFRGSRMRYTAEYPDGNKEVLLSVPNFVFDWQPMYTLSETKPMPGGTRIVCDGAFNNSKFNPRNPNPNQWVYFGEQSFEEMFIGYVQYAVPYSAEDFAPEAVAVQNNNGGETLTTENIVGTKWRLFGFILEFKADGELLISGQYKGKWTVKDANNIYIESGLRNIYVAIVNNNLSFMGRPLRKAE